MKKSIRLIACLLGALTLVSAAVSCGTPAAENEVTTAAPALTTEAVPEQTSAPETEVNALNILGPRDLGGRTVTFYSRYYNGVWSSDLFYEQNDGDVFGSAVFKRNTDISEQYHVELKENRSGAQSFRDKVASLIASNDTSYDILYFGLSEAANAAQAGLLQNLGTAPNLNLTGPWWNQSSNAAWSFGSRLYFTTGDITTVDDMSVRSMFFNKDMINDNKMESPYTLVENNQWTYEKFFEMVNAAAVDVGQDGVNKDVDIFGVTAQTTLGFMMTMASGEMLIRKDGTDIPYLAVADDSARIVDVVSYLTDHISGNSAVYMGPDADELKVFTDGRALFLAEVLYHAKNMRQNYDVNFGILPMPKYSADQENYYQYTTGYCNCVVCLPVTTVGRQLDDASFVLEAMAVESVSSVTPAYYEVNLKGRYVEDYESSSMIDIICSSVASDLAEIYGWGGLKTSIQDGISNGTSITTLIKSGKKPATTAMNKTVDAILALPASNN